MTAQPSLSIFTLPDVAVTEPPPAHLRIDWVGMRQISLPAFYRNTPLNLSLGVSVDLPDPAAKGIHMSRLYQLVQQYLVGARLTPLLINQCLEALLESHQAVGSQRAKLALQGELLLERPALISPLTGWKRYPLAISAQRDLLQSTGELRVSLGIDYASTCPCSAALSRQLLQKAFVSQWQNKSLSIDAVEEWLGEQGSLATPHSQRSRALIEVPLWGEDWDLEALINRCEDTLGTPVQTAVKRVDEQAFARLNGEHLMYVEDAMRRLQQALAADYPGACIELTHHESLHQHDAWARHHIPSTN